MSGGVEQASIAGMLRTLRLETELRRMQSIEAFSASHVLT